MRRYFLLLSFYFFIANYSNAQTTILATNYSGSLWYATALGSGVCFNVVNNSSNCLSITSVGYCSYSSIGASSVTTTLWYSASSLTGNAGPIASPTWIQLASVTAPPAYPTLNNNFFTGFSLLMQPGVTYRFAVVADANSNALFGGPANSFPTFVYTANNVSLDVTNTLFSNGNATTTAMANTGYGYYGSITFHQLCSQAPAGLGVSAITSNSATASWNAVSGSLGYEYVATTTAAPPASGTPTSATSGPLTGLTPATNYYLHVRNICTGNAPSCWTTYSFTTLPPCKPPLNFHVTNLQSTSATINWDPWPSALSYDYIVDQSPNDPTSITGLNNIPTTSDGVTGLSEYTWYYVHVRSVCAGGETSNWLLDSFLTPIPCRAPDIKIDHINADQAVAYWAAVPSAYAYEYVLTKSATPPALGTLYEKTSLLTSALKDNNEYYIHVRSHCNSVNVLDISPWATASFKTFPAGVNDVSGSLHVEVYPNPVKDVVTIKLNGSRSGTAKIILTDLSGREINSTEINSDKVEINMAGLPAGIYLIRYSDQVNNGIYRIHKE